MEDYKVINEDLQNRVDYYEDLKIQRKKELENEIINSTKYFDDRIAEIKKGIELNNKHCCSVYIIKGQY